MIKVSDMKNQNTIWPPKPNVPEHTLVKEPLSRFVRIRNILGIIGLSAASIGAAFSMISVFYRPAWAGFVKSSSPCSELCIKYWTFIDYATIYPFWVGLLLGFVSCKLWTGKFALAFSVVFIGVFMYDLSSI